MKIKITKTITYTRKETTTVENKESPPPKKKSPAEPKRQPSNSNHITIVNQN